MCARSPMNKASDYGSEEWEFESLRAHQRFSQASKIVLANAQSL